MLVTSVKIELATPSYESDRIRAYAHVVIDDSLAIRDLRIIDGFKQGLFIVMPCRKITDRCHECGNKNALSARFCGSCGDRLDSNRITRNHDGTLCLDAKGRPRHYADIVYPINADARKIIHDAVIAAYLAERDQSAVA